MNLQILQEQIYDCVKCPFDEDTDAHYCGGFGNDHRVMFIAESPSTSGGVGKFLSNCNFSSTKADELFNNTRAKYGLQGCYLTDFVKCGIPNGKPNGQKVEMCIDYLKEEIKIINPLIIVTVGKTFSIKSDKRINQYQFDDFIKTRLGVRVPVLWTYHYSWVFRYNRNKQNILNEYDMQHKNILTYL